MAACWSAEAEYIYQYLFCGFSFQSYNRLLQTLKLHIRSSVLRWNWPFISNNNKEGVSLGLEDFKNLEVTAVLMATNMELLVLIMFTMVGVI